MFLLTPTLRAAVRANLCAADRLCLAATCHELRAEEDGVQTLAALLPPAWRASFGYALQAPAAAGDLAELAWSLARQLLRERLDAYPACSAAAPALIVFSRGGQARELCCVWPAFSVHLWQARFAVATAAADAVERAALPAAARPGWMTRLFVRVRATRTTYTDGGHPRTRRRPLRALLATAAAAAAAPDGQESLTC
jgi:hypothetical protein